MERIACGFVLVVEPSRRRDEERHADLAWTPAFCQTPPHMLLVTVQQGCSLGRGGAVASGASSYSEEFTSSC